MKKSKTEIIKYLTYEEDGIENPFLQVKQSSDGKNFYFRFLRLHKEQNFCLQYSRHPNRIHFVYFKDGKPYYPDSDKHQRIPLKEIKTGENIAYLLMTKTTMKRKPLENISNFQTLLKIKGEKYPKSLVPVIIYLNPNMTEEKAKELAQPIQLANDKSYNPPVLVITYKYDKSFTKLGVTMY